MTEITNKAQYEWAVRRVEEILRRIDACSANLEDPQCPYGAEGTAEVQDLDIELKLLSDLVSDYSDKHFSIGKASLPEMMELRMYEMGLSGKDVAELIGVSPSRISEYLSGKSEPTLKVGREICRKLDIDPSIVLGV